MKLVDILARELKVWPEKSVAAVQQNSTDDRVSFVDCMDVEFSMGQWDYSEPCMRIHEQKESHEFERADDWKAAIVTRAEWQAAVDALNADKCEHSYANNIGCPECGELNAPKIVEWDGKGNPPAGSSIEYSIGDGWYPCEVRYVLSRDDCSGIALIAWCEHLGKDQYLSNDRDHYFRPVRTAEQVAAEERNNVIREMVAEVTEEPRARHFAFCEVLYDAGYRKEPKPCGS